MKFLEWLCGYTRADADIRIYDMWYTSKRLYEYLLLEKMDKNDLIQIDCTISTITRRKRDSFDFFLGAGK